jgi:non-ribosomal peptide synthetase component F
VNTLVVRGDVTGDPSFSELLARVRETTLGAYAHQDLPFEKLVEELAPERDLSRNPLCQVAFQLFSDPTGAPRDVGPAPQRLDIQRGTAVFDLVITLSDDGDGFAGRIEFNTDLFDRPTVERLAGHYSILLEAALKDSGAAVARLPILAEHELRELDAFNATDAPVPERCLHELIEEQVARTPDAVAARFEGEELTYRELDARANRLGHHLRERGVGPGKLVAIRAERSL